MILEQCYLGCLSQASYLVGDGEAGVGAVVDPRRDVGIYLERAEELGIGIRYVLLTHFHADFVSGHLELARATGAEVCLGAAAEAAFVHRKLADGDEVVLGGVRVRAWATPGHTPESVSYLVFDGPEAGEPAAVLTGDVLFLGDVGRPDLMASVGITAEELAGQLYDSTRRLLGLPDGTLVYPGHGAGSMCGKNLSSETVSTMGAQRRGNHALQPMEREEFVAMVTAGQPAAPAYFAHDAGLNRVERPTLDEALRQSRRALTAGEVLRLQEQGAQVVDVRDADDFARAHLRGSVFIGLQGRFASWCGTLLTTGEPIVVIADPGREEEALVRLGRIGFDHVAGFLDGGIEALVRACPESVASAGRIDVQAFRRRTATEPRPFVLDVRQPAEVEAGAVEGACAIPLGELPDRLDEVPADRELLVYCASGYRSMIAESLLLQHGRENVRDLAGGIEALR